jgi:hypothetical protein
VPNVLLTHTFPEITPSCAASKTPFDSAVLPVIRLFCASKSTMPNSPLQPATLFVEHVVVREAAEGEPKETVARRDVSSHVVARRRGKVETVLDVVRADVLLDGVVGREDEVETHMSIAAGRVLLDGVVATADR